LEKQIQPRSQELKVYMVTFAIIAAALGVCVIVMAAILTAAERRPVTAYDAMCDAIDRSLDGRRPVVGPARTTTAFLPTQRSVGSVARASV
jgi:hypothetical protein